MLTWNSLHGGGMDIFWNYTITHIYLHQDLRGHGGNPRKVYKVYIKLNDQLSVSNRSSEYAY